MTEKQHWNEEATETLLVMWGRDVIKKKQKQLKWDPIFDKASEVLHSMGYNFSGKQCHTKLKNMIQIYRRVKKSASQTGKEPDCLFYRELEFIFDPLEMPVPPLFQRMHVEIDSAPAMASNMITAGGSPDSVSSSERSMEVPSSMAALSNGNTGNMARQLPVLFSLGGPHGNDAGRSQQFIIPAATEIQNQLPQMTTVVTIETDESPEHDPAEVEPPTNASSGSSSSENEEEEVDTARDTQKEKKLKRLVAKDSDLETLVALLQEEAEDREDARQQRLLEHEARMEERRRKWEEQRRERELEAMQKWEELRREREFQQMRHVTNMFLQGLERLLNHRRVEGMTSSQNPRNVAFSQDLEGVVLSRDLEGVALLRDPDDKLNPTGDSLEQED